MTAPLVSFTYRAFCPALSVVWRGRLRADILDQGLAECLPGGVNRAFQNVSRCTVRPEDPLAKVN
jgi:hypothetical protein